jgi:uncharacterized protein involved in outer membrane biogenesis
MRKLGIVILVILILVIAAALIVPRFIDINRYRPQIQAQLEKRLGRPVTLGEMNLGLFPPRFRVNNVSISEDPQFNTGKPFATAQQLSVAVKLWPLLHKQVDVQSLRLDRPQVELVRNPQGVWNYGSLGKAPSTGQPQPAPSGKPSPEKQPPQAPQPQTGPGEQLSLAKLVMMDGQVAVTDEQKRQPRAVYDHIDLTLTDFAPGQKFSIDATAHLPGGGKQSIALKGKGGPLAEEMINTPFDGTLKLEQAAISSLQRFLNAQVLQGVEAQLSGNASINNSNAKLTSSGDLRAENSQLRNVKVGYPITLNYDATMDKNNEQIQVRKGDLKLGATPVSFSGTVNAKATPVQVDGKLRAQNASIEEAKRLASAFGMVLDKNMDAKGTVDADLTIKTSNNMITSSGELRAQNAQVRNVKVGYPITLNYDATMDQSKQVIQVRKGDVKLGATPVSFTGTVNAKATPAQIDGRLTAKNASIEEAARLASAFGVAFNKNMDVKGFVDADVQAKGPTSKPVLNGQVTARNLSISGDGLPQPVQADNVALTLTPAAIRSNDFTAKSGSTNVTVNFALANYTGNNSTINAAVRAPNAKIAELISMARAAGVSAANDISGDGVLNLDMRAQGPTKNMSAMVFSGNGKLQNANLKLPSLTKPIQVRNADIAFSQNSANLNNLAATIGQTNATGNMTVKNFAAPQVQFTLNADKVDVDELKQLFANAPAAPAKKASTSDFWQLVPRAEAQTVPPAQPGAPAAPPAANAQPSMITKMTGTGVVTIGTVKNQELVLNNVHSNVTLNHGLITLNPLTADLYGGKETGNVVMDLRPAQPVYTVNLTSQKVDANQLLSSVSSIKQTLYGLLASNVNATFSSNSPDAIARSLNGKVSMDLLNGKLMNVDLLHELATVGQFAPSLGRATQGFTNIVRLSGNFDIRNGVAQTNNLKAAIDGGNLAGVGLINLADQTLNMRVTAVLDKALSQKVGGTQIGGYMNTALANNQGELVLPVIVTGNLKHPLIAPDVQQIAQMKLKNIVPNSQNITGAITQILGGKSQGGGGNNGNQGGQGMPQGDLGGIVGAITGKQQQQQNQQQQPQGQPPQQPQGQPQQQAQPQQQPAAGTQPQPQAQPQSTPDPVGDLLNKVLKKKPSPTPTPQ